MAIKVGDTAPDFNLTAQNGENISLGDFRGQKSVVLYFYPKDDTPGCTVESCAFRDQYEVFQAAGAEVIGVSGDSRDSHQKGVVQYVFDSMLNFKGHVEEALKTLQQLAAK
ncbi:peroxiredoxin [Dolichospermum sp. ST_sed9]|nr:peroxiredoxin [Dolichospermum sp. ST_sed9]